MTARFDISDALSDARLLGASLGDIATWRVWTSVIKATFGLKLSDDELITFRSVAGDRAAPTQRVSELWVVAGRRAGKSRMSAALATYVALFVDHSKRLAAGETGFVLCLAPTLQQAGLVHSYIAAFIQSSPVLSQQIERVLASEIRLKGNITIATHACSFRSIRGRTLLALVADESAFWRDELSARPDIEAYRAVLPALASTGGLWIGISTPYRRAGLLYSKHRDHYGQDGDVLVIQAASTTLNPTLDRRIIAAAEQADPEAAASEWHAQFRSDLSSLFDDALIDMAIDYDRPAELPPVPGVRYRCFADMSGGRVDAACMAIAHREQDGLVVVDLLRGRAAPHDPQSVAQDFAALAKSYGCSEITGDRYSGAWVEQAFVKAGVRYEVSDLSKSEIYLECVAHFATGKVRLPNNDKLTREMRLLERRTGRSGRDAVDHLRGASDDYANAACGAIDLCLRVQPGFMRLGAVRPDGLVYWHGAERPRLRIRTITVSEADAPAVNWDAPVITPFNRASG